MSQTWIEADTKIATTTNAMVYDCTYSCTGGDNCVGFNPSKSTNQKARGFEPLLGSALLVGPFIIITQDILLIHRDTERQS